MSARTLTWGSAERLAVPHFGQRTTGDTICRSDRICCSIASSLSRKSISAGNNIAKSHSHRSLASISGNHTLWGSPAAIDILLRGATVLSMLTIIIISDRSATRAPLDCLALATLNRTGSAVGVGCSQWARSRLFDQVPFRLRQTAVITKWALQTASVALNTTLGKWLSEARAASPRPSPVVFREVRLAGVADLHTKRVTICTFSLALVCAPSSPPRRQHRPSARWPPSCYSPCRERKAPASTSCRANTSSPYE